MFWIDPQQFTTIQKMGRSDAIDVPSMLMSLYQTRHFARTTLSLSSGVEYYYR